MLLPKLEDRLNQNINLKDYTDRVERIYFAPILMPEGTNGIEEEKWFDEGKRAIMLKVKIDQVALNQIQLGQSISTILKKHLTKFLPNRLFAGIDYALRMPE